MRRLILASLLVALFSLPAAHADEPFDRLISPVSNPTNFEDPRSITEARIIYMYHKIGDDFVTDGGDLRVFTIQFRVEMDDRLSLILNKMGLYDFDTDGGIGSESGLQNIGIGVKYAFYKDRREGLIMTGGLRYETPSGDSDVAQGEGDGIFNPFLSAGLTLRDINMMASTGFRFPFSGEDSSSYDLDLHFDMPMGQFYPLVEFGMTTVLNTGERLASESEGLDLINFGSRDADGATALTGAVGARYRFNENFIWGIGYQYPITQNSASDFLDWRLTTDLIYSIP